MPKQQEMRWPLPEVVHPSSVICYKIQVPNERHYIGAFLGAMYLLSKPYAWGDDSAHTALEVGAVWRAIFDSLISGECELPPTPPVDQGGEQDDFMPIRIDCDCNVFITCCDGTEKQILTADQVKAIVGGQQGGNTPVPAPGTCQGYQAKVDAGRVWLLPAIVNTGDTLNINALSGATTDDAPLGRWSCPDGSYYLAGTCESVFFTDPAAPLPLLPLGQLIWHIGTNFYDALTAFTVPGSITNEQCTLELNYPSGGSYAGTAAAEVQFCNNGAGSWSHTFDFTTGTKGWTTYDTGGGNFFGAFSFGAGFTGTDGINTGTNARGVAIKIAFPARDITGFDVVFDYTKGTADDPSAVAWDRETAVLWGATHFSATSNGTDLTTTDSGFAAAQTTAAIQFLSDLTAGAVSGSVTIHSVTLHGDGIDPF
jgi:hypothetical protein